MVFCQVCKLDSNYAMMLKMSSSNKRYDILQDVKRDVVQVMLKRTFFKCQFTSKCYLCSGALLACDLIIVPRFMEGLYSNKLSPFLQASEGKRIEKQR